MECEVALLTITNERRVSVNTINMLGENPVEAVKESKHDDQNRNQIVCLLFCLETKYKVL